MKRYTDLKQLQGLGLTNQQHSALQTLRRSLPERTTLAAATNLQEVNVVLVYLRFSFWVSQKVLGHLGKFLQWTCPRYVWYPSGSAWIHYQLWSCVASVQGNHVLDQMSLSSVSLFWKWKSNVTNLFFADLKWFTFSPCWSDVKVYSRTLWHRHRVWLQVQQTWNFEPERAVKHCFSACCSVSL